MLDQTITATLADHDGRLTSTKLRKTLRNINPDDLDIAVAVLLDDRRIVARLEPHGQRGHVVLELVGYQPVVDSVRRGDMTHEETVAGLAAYLAERDARIAARQRRTSRADTMSGRVVT